MRPFSVSMEEGRCFMSSTVRFGQVPKWQFVVDCSKVFLTGLKMDPWYHLDSSGFILAAR